LQVHVNSALVFLGSELETKFLTDLLNTRLDLLDMIDRVNALSHNPSQTELVSNTIYHEEPSPAGIDLRSPDEDFNSPFPKTWAELTHADGSVHAP
jgi:hypothetical protein